MESRKKVKNTFAPNIHNKELSGRELVKALQFGLVRYGQLSQEAKDLVNRVKPTRWII